MLGCAAILAGCDGSAASSGAGFTEAGSVDDGAVSRPDGSGQGPPDSSSEPVDAPGAVADTSLEGGSAGDGACMAGDGGCYSITCDSGGIHSLHSNRDRLIADLSKRKCTDSCSLWAALNEGERYIFLMDTAYLGAPSSQLYPPGASNLETAMDHAVALYSINGPDAGQGVLFNGLGGNDYNRIYVGFDALANCVMRDFTIANPTHEAGYNAWVKSDDLQGSTCTSAGLIDSGVCP